MFIDVEPHTDVNCNFCKLSEKDWKTFVGKNTNKIENKNTTDVGKRKMKNDESSSHQATASKRSALCQDQVKSSGMDFLSDQVKSSRMDFLSDQVKSSRMDFLPDFPALISNSVYLAPQSDCSFSRPCPEGTSYQQLTSIESSFGPNIQNSFGPNVQTQPPTTAIPPFSNFFGYNNPPQDQSQNFEIEYQQIGSQQFGQQFETAQFSQQNYYNPNPNEEVIDDDSEMIPGLLETDSSQGLNQIWKSVSPDSGINSNNSPREVDYLDHHLQEIDDQVGNPKEGEEEFSIVDENDLDLVLAELLRSDIQFSSGNEESTVENILLQTPNSNRTVDDGAEKRKSEQISSDGIGMSPVSESTTRLQISAILPNSESRRSRRLAMENENRKEFRSLAAIFGCILVAVIFRFFIFK